MKDIKNCVVGVLVDGVLQGTGYVATDELVITCAHVLTDEADPPADGISVRFHCNGEDVPVDVSTKSWSPRDADDIAALKLRGSLPDGVEVASLAPSAGRKNRECEVFGYPDVANFDGLGGRAKVIEEIREFDGRRLIQLESKQATCGYSGSPLLDPDTGEVIGTVMEIAEQARARYAEQLHARLDNLAFATPLEVIEALVPDLPVDSDEDLDAHAKTRERALESILEILSIQGVTPYLAVRIGGMDECSEDAQRERVAQHLLDSSLADFLPLVIDGFARHAKEHEIAEAFRDLATCVLPQIYREDFLREIRRRLTSGDNFLVIPASHRSVIELLIAGAMGHKLSFDDTWRFDGDIPRGSHEIVPSAELGIIEDDTLRKFIDGFERAIMVKIGGLPAGMPDPTRAINRKLAKLKIGEPPIRYYYVYRNGQSRVEELESRYPDVVFICHELTGHDDDEFDILDCLKDMFCPESDP